MKRKTYLIFLILVLGCFTVKSKAQNDNNKKDTVYYSPGGTYSDWYFSPAAVYSSLEWTFIPVADPPASLAKEGLLHYYAYNFSLLNSSGSVGGGYAGFQTNGIFRGTQEGKVINFSIWGSNAGKTNGLLNTGNEESGGVQIMYRYNWTVGHPYHFELKEGPSRPDSSGKWWGLWVTDKTTGIKSFIGEQRVPSVINGKNAVSWAPHTSMFGEDLHWWNSLNGHKKYNDYTVFQNSAMAAVDITANGGILKPIKLVTRDNSGEQVKGSNGFKSVGSPVSIYKDPEHMNVQHNLGYWASPAPDFLHKQQ